MQKNKHVEDWLAWLRDPANKQTPGVMKRVDDDGNAAYCCLGGACELAGVELKKQANSSISRTYGVEQAPGWIDMLLLPEWLRELLTLTPEDQRFAAAMNDGDSVTQQLSFPQIADVIELAADNGASLRAAYDELHPAPTPSY